jgi:hypothetical protein|nr:MAG TPA: protein of unknown function (DUF5118) [Caudoviricetes sp.]
MKYDDVKEIFLKAYNTKLQILDYIKKNRNFNNNFENFCVELDDLTNYDDVKIYFEKGKFYLEIPEDDENCIFGSYLCLENQEIENI